MLFHQVWKFQHVSMRLKQSGGLRKTMNLSGQHCLVRVNCSLSAGVWLFCWHWWCIASHTHGRGGQAGWAACSHKVGALSCHEQESSKFRCHSKSLTVAAAAPIIFRLWGSAYFANALTMFYMDIYDFASGSVTRKNILANPQCQVWREWQTSICQAGN